MKRVCLEVTGSGHYEINVLIPTTSLEFLLFLEVCDEDPKQKPLAFDTAE